MVIFFIIIRMTTNFIPQNNPNIIPFPKELAGMNFQQIPIGYLHQVWMFSISGILKLLV